ncbi:hypothetical protein HanRHA438_Chr17g0815091 [Helianthus annuus]|nr:hypothetical protein HanHA89_Chr17g0708261 [Helianthus annuus]KAJ0632597.1 hypothetical protein HanLR1_Chr17g0666891 [Helianthus annuus]KAJ0826507.1 hypothetical protein HanRHA438_Chr17g0815081 [Helianthus annuus]KAJ0826508.1 hypothetical protein HanRHA438_Chr17g0815091 [Helianthus annuus]
MAAQDEKNVFGKPITEGTRMERAIEALNNPDAGGKRGEALEYVRKQKELSRKEVSTLCMFYNATGETLAYDDGDSRDGSKVYGTYPDRVRNGQWGAFLHVGTTGRSSGFVVYRVKNNDTDYCSQLLGWENPGGGCHNSNNHAHCNIFKDGVVDPADEVYKRMELSSRQDKARKLEMHTKASIEEGISPVYEAKFTREEAEASSLMLYAAALQDDAAEQDVEASSAT